MLQRATKRPGGVSLSGVLIIATTGALLLAALLHGDPAQGQGASDALLDVEEGMSPTGPPAPPVDRSGGVGPPAPPSSLYGVVTWNDQDVFAGTVIYAVIGESSVASTETIMYLGHSFYTIDVPADDPGTEEVEGGSQGDAVVLIVAGLPADQTARWQGGTNRQLDLAVRGAWPSALYLPSADRDSGAAAR